MKLTTSLVILGTVTALASAQSLPPKPRMPIRTSFTELTAYNYAGYTPQQLWQVRNLEHNVKFDSYLRCFSDVWRQNGVEQQYNAWCSSSEVHWDASKYPQCSTNYYSNVDIPSYIKQFWAAYDQYTVYQGIVEDPYYVTGLRYHRAKHATQNKWIWYRTNDTAIVYEQFYDGTQNSFVKFYPGGIVENPWLYTQDFRIPKCTNPFMALPEVPMTFDSVFSLVASNSTSNSTNEAAAPVKKNEDEFQTYTRWVMENYDVNKDGFLDEKETKKMLDDAMKMDVSISDVQVWLNRFDKNKDGKLSIEEIAVALEDI